MGHVMRDERRAGWGEVAAAGVALARRRVVDFEGGVSHGWKRRNVS